MEHDARTHLQQTLLREMPICLPMGIEAIGWDVGRLTVQMPLAPNRNHQDSAFAGSLNALCTIAGWGAIFLLLHERGLTGNIVIRRSAIRYLVPVRTAEIVARSTLIAADELAYFLELLQSKGKSKIDCSSSINVGAELAVSFHGSYVVQDCVARENVL